MTPDSQDQHKIPKVYLKQFGYQNRNRQWKVSVMKHGEQRIGQKSIGSFTALPNIFDINSEDPRIQRMFENINGNLESSYNVIIGELAHAGRLSERSTAYLIQLIANLIVRADVWREQILFLLESDVKDNFLKIVLGHHCRNEEEFGRIHELDYYRNLADFPPLEVINKVLLYFIDHLLLRLYHFELVFLQAAPGKHWFTSTNPVVLHNRTARFEFFAEATEIYFPLTQELLVYAHFPGSTDRENPFRGYAPNQIHQLNDADTERVTRFILENATDYVIFPGEYHPARENAPNA